jgi:hypothetical protein
MTEFIITQELSVLIVCVMLHYLQVVHTDLHKIEKRYLNCPDIIHVDYVHFQFR